MNVQDHDSEDYGKKVWLSNGDVEQLMDAAEDTEQRIAFGLGAYCGLRSAEWLDVEPRHVVDSDAGKMLMVPDGKGGQYRETPIPETLASTIRAVGDMGPGDDVPVIQSASSTRVLRKWCSRARERLEDETDEPRWQYLSPHDLRRTWATNLRAAGADPLVVLAWGGWNDLETFLDHYQGTHSPEMQREERSKVDWL